MKYYEQDIKRVKEQAAIQDLLVIVKLQVGKTDWEEIHLCSKLYLFWTNRHSNNQSIQILFRQPHYF